MEMKDWLVLITSILTFLGVIGVAFMQIGANKKLKRQEIIFEPKKARLLTIGDRQFNAYCELWQLLCDLEDAIKKVIDNYDEEQIRYFDEIYKKVCIVAKKSSILIEEVHYRQLKTYIDSCNELRNTRYEAENVTECVKRSPDGLSTANICDKGKERIDEMLQRFCSMKNRLSKVLDNYRYDFKISLGIIKVTGDSVDEMKRELEEGSDPLNKPVQS